ncbi:MAG: transglutaminase domain-containing protein [Blastocatellia bacterium]
MFNSRYVATLVLLVFSLFSLTVNVFAQSKEREIEWNSYNLPTGNFVRFVDLEKGYWFWHPAEWQEKKNANGNSAFIIVPQGPNFVIVVDDIADGYGLANYTSSLLQGFRKYSINQETFSLRTVSIGGIEAREAHFEIEINDRVANETVWVTAVGPKAYNFIFAFDPADKEKFEPYIKRVVETISIGAAGHWDREFEVLRAKFADQTVVGSELAAINVAKKIRNFNIPKSEWTKELTELIAKSPISAIDLLTDSDPQVRAEAILQISKINDPKFDEILLWALTDKDSYCSTIAAQVFATRGLDALNLLKKKLPDLIDKPGVILRVSAAFNDQNVRQVIYDESIKTGKLADWAKEPLSELTKLNNLSLINKDKLSSELISKLINAPTTGETLFPKDSTHYLMTPNFQGTLEKLDAAISGIQLNTVRDQMTLALIIKTLKARLAEELKINATSDISSTIGINLKAPIALAAWPKDEKTENISAHSAVIVPIYEKSRFERLLALYQNQFGDFDSFSTVNAALARIATIIPAILPVGMAVAISSIEGKEREVKPLHKETYFEHHLINNLPLTVIKQLNVFEGKPTEYSNIFVLYLGDTAIVAPSQEAIAHLILSANQESTIGTNKDFAQVKAQTGEVVFFSQIGKLIKTASIESKVKEPQFIENFIALIGNEIGVLQINKNSCETLFNFNLSSQTFANTIKVFKPWELSAARELLPDNTIFYAGTKIDAPKLWDLLKSATEETKNKKKSQDPLDIEIEKTILSQLEGEVAFALISIKPLVVDIVGKDKKDDKDDKAKLPAIAYALKLRDNTLANQFRNNKIFKSFAKIPAATFLNSPVAIIKFDNYEHVLSVTDGYIVLADSIETLKLLEMPEKFASTRDYIRSIDATSDNLALFATYNLDSAFNEAASLSNNNAMTKEILTAMGAMLRAFHSQRASISIKDNNLEGRLAVSFDREGRYSISELTKQVNDFDVANAIVSAKGINTAQSSRIESLKLRIKTKPEVISGLQNEIKKFPWQQVEATSENNLILQSSARQIPDNQSVVLPVAGDEFAPYLGATSRINSTDPQIIELAKQIVGDDKDSRSVARKLGEWTYSNLKWKKVQSDSVETLTSREADCFEHSELYVALARACGLPARVVTGAALSGGSFGSHAWVEVYLGKWVEVDPTWGLMDYVDATHLRFDDTDTFISYAMLNQIEMEILEARPFVADFQRDPVKLITTITSKDSQVAEEMAFDLSLVAENVLGANSLINLTEKQRASVVSSFERVLAKELKKLKGSIKILRSEVKNQEANIFALDNENRFLDFHLVKRGEAWYIVEIKNNDYGLAIFDDTLKSAIEERLPIIKLVENSNTDFVVNELDKLIAKNNQPHLLLAKASILQEKEIRKIHLNRFANDERPKEEPNFEVPQKLFQELMTNWPQFAPSYFLSTRRIFNEDKNLETAIPLLQRYAELMPADPRPWESLGDTLINLKRFDEAEKAYYQAIARDDKNFSYHTALTQLYIKQSNIEKAKESFANVLKVAPNLDEAFSFIVDFFYDSSKEDLEKVETIVSSFPDQLNTSKFALSLLSSIQNGQEKYEEALKTRQKALALKEEIDDYVFIAYLNRKLRDFKSALEASEQAIKLETEYIEAHFEKACALAQLGNKQDALAALKKAVALDSDFELDMDDPDLKPLEKLTEFKTLKANYQE